MCWNDREKEKGKKGVKEIGTGAWKWWCGGEEEGEEEEDEKSRRRG